MDLISQYKRDSDQIYNQILDVCYFMKGGVTWDQAWAMSFNDRERLVTMLNKRLKAQSGDNREYM